MKIRKAEFFKSAICCDTCPSCELPEFSFIGRSNVGKSSLINHLCHKQGLARVSKTPGRTQEINFFNVDDRWRLVDLPGYGYAKVSKSQRDVFNDFVSEYLLTRSNLVGTFVLLDSRHSPQKIDLQFVEWLIEAGVSIALVFTKTDKSKPKIVKRNINLFLEAMRDFCGGSPTVFESSIQERHGKKGILEFIDEILSQYSLGLG